MSKNDIVIFPFIDLPNASERNQKRVRRWKSEDRFVGALRMFVWLMSLALVIFLGILFVLAGSAILLPIPILIGLKIFVTPPFGIPDRE